MPPTFAKMSANRCVTSVPSSFFGKHLFGDRLLKKSVHTVVHPEQLFAQGIQDRRFWFIVAVRTRGRAFGVTAQT